MMERCSRVFLNGVLFWSACGMAILSSTSHAQMRITEYQYQGGDLTSEFIEFTNVGVSPVNMSGWTYDDSDGPPVNISAFGTVNPGQSVIICEASAAAFNAAWNLSGVIVIGLNSNNLGRNDSIKLINNSAVIVDQLDYGDQTFPGSIRAQSRSGFPCLQALGANNAYGWRLSSVGDSQGSFLSSFFDTGSPGQYTNFSCPADPTGACCAAGQCTILTQAECVAEGLYQGNGTNCSITCPAPTNANVRITEFMHTGTGGEFIEFRNMGGTSVNMANWHFSDETRAPGQVDLSAYGTIAAGEVVILTEIVAGDFRTDWGLPGSVKVIGGNTTNIGNIDEINLYDSSGALVDRLTYGGVTCSPDADTVSDSPCSAAVGNNDILEWRRAAVGDGRGSHLSLVGDIGNPGLYTAVGCTPGSCCINNVCSVQSQGDCLSAGGLYLGDGTNCGTTPCPAADTSNVRVTEFMYQGADGEFFEITNFGTTSVNLAGWSFADRCQAPGVFAIGGLGTLTPGQSAIVTDAVVASFNSDWNLTGVPVLRLPSSELGSDDEIRLHNGSKALVDVIHYGNLDFPGTPFTQNISAWPNASAVHKDQINSWYLSAVGDVQSSYTSSGGDIGNPGTYASINIPAASTWGLVVFVIALMTVGTLAKRRKVIATTNC